MEEDDPTHAVGHGGIRGEEDVTEAATVLLIVLHFDFLETLPHGSLRGQDKQNPLSCTLCPHIMHRLRSITENARLTC